MMIKKLLFTLFMIAFAHPSFAQDEKVAEAKSIHIAVVDVQQLMGLSKAGKSIQSQGKSIIDKYQNQIEDIQKELKKAESEVTEAQSGKDEKAFKNELESFQKKLKESQKEAQDIRVKNDKAVADALNILRDEIVSIVDEMTVKNKYDIVLTREDIITVSKDIDITADVMKELDKRLKTVKVRN